MMTEPLATPDSVGMDPRKIDDLQRQVKQQLATGLSPGTQVVVARHAQVVLDMALGMAWALADISTRRVEMVKPSGKCLERIIGRIVRVVWIARESKAHRRRTLRSVGGTALSMRVRLTSLRLGKT